MTTLTLNLLYEEIIMLQGALLCTRRGLIVSTAYWRAFAACKRKKEAKMLECLLFATLRSLSVSFHRLKDVATSMRICKVAAAKVIVKPSSAPADDSSISQTEVIQRWRQYAKGVALDKTHDEWAELHWSYGQMSSALRMMKTVI